MFRTLRIIVSIVTLTSLAFSFLIVGDATVNAESTATLEPPANDTSEVTHTDYGKMPLIFEQNKGQTDQAVKFISRAPGYTVYLSETEAVFALKIAGDEPVDVETNPKTRAANASRHSDVLRMRFAGANTKPEVSGGELIGTKTNYYTGKKRLENLLNYKNVRFERLYDGIDAVFYSNAGNQFEYDFIVAPNTDAGQIRLSFDGAKLLQTDIDGNLRVKTANTELVQQKPIAFQQIDGRKQDVPVSYSVAGSVVSFALGEYDRSKPLVIDPALSYLTYIGGTAFDQVFEIAADAQGNAYITGATTSLDFHGETRSGADLTGTYAAKINADGTQFEYITILEGTGDDSGFGIALDANNSVYLAGRASEDFPTTAGAFDENHGSIDEFDAFATKLDANGNVVYSTFIGGSGLDQAFDIAVDASGKAYVVGDTFSTQFFPTKNRFQGCGVFFPLSLNSIDAFLTVFNAAGSDITYSTCIGGSVITDQAFSVALDGANNAYVTGRANGGNFPTKNASQSASGGGVDAWIAKFNPSLSGNDSLIYSTYIGGSGTDVAFSIAAAANGTASITGVTGSANFPLQNAIDSTNQINEAFIAQYNSSGTKLNSTFLGGTDQDQGSSIAVGNGGTIYIAGDTLSNDFPMATPFQSTRQGGRDGFVAKIRFGVNSNPGVSSSSYLGGSGNEQPNGIALRGNFIFVGGKTQSNNLLTTSGVIKPTSAANATNPDGFVAKILDSRKDTIGTFDPLNTTFDLRNTLNAGGADIVVDRGIVGDIAVAGDTNGDGIDTVSTFNSGVWKISNFNVIVSGYGAGAITANFGLAGDLPVVGDWDGDGIETLGVYRPSAGQFFLSNSISNPQINFQLTFGIAEDLPIAGDWDGDGIDSVGVFRPSAGQFFLTNDNIAAPNIDVTAFFGTNGDLPVGGDWDGNGIDSIGVWRPSTLEFFLSNNNSAIADQFVFGAAGDRPVVGDWDGKPNQ